MFQKPLFSDEFLTELTALDARALLTDAYPLLWHAVYEPWSHFQEDRKTDPRFRDLTEAEAAWWLYTQIKRAATDLASDSPNFRMRAVTDRHNQFYLDFDGRAILVFKKLIRRWSARQQRFVLERSNFLTKHNCDFWQQRKEEGAPLAPRVIIGYEPIKEMTEIKVWVCYPRTRGRRFVWAYRMPNQIDAAKWLSKPPTPIMPSPPSVEADFVVNPRNFDTDADDQRGAS